MSTLKVNNLQVGQDATASNNFTLYQPAVPDGTVRLGYGNVGSVTDSLTFTNTGRLGIGNTNPSHPLEVTGVARATYLISTSYSVFGSIVAADPGSNYYSWNNRIGGGLAVAGTTYLDGYVGIGTASPQRKLHVHAPGVDLSVIRLSGSAVLQTEYDIRQGIVGITNAGFSIYDVSASTTRFCLTSSGNVGIGTDNPSKKLHVIGDIRQDYSTRSSGGFAVNPNGGTRTIVISGLQNGCCMFHMGGYSSAGQSQMHECAIMGGFMTATTTYNVTRLASWTNGAVSYTYAKNSQDVTYVITNSSIYTLNIAWYLDDSSFSQITAVTVT